MDIDIVEQVQTASIVEQVQTATIVDSSTVSVNLTNVTNSVNVTTSSAMPISSSSSGIAVTPYNTITATNLQSALEQLADEKFVQITAPSSNIEGGDFWYNTDEETLYVYREVSGVFNWVPVITGNSDSDSDTIDAGSY